MKQSELLRKQADMIDMAEKYGIDDWRKLVKVTNGNGYVVTLATPEYILYAGAAPEFALGVVEGKPVFEGDEMWCNLSKHKFKVAGLCNGGLALEYVTMYQGRQCASIDSCSWNPPKPKTVMVELEFEDVEYYARFAGGITDGSDRLYYACRKALESIKQS